MRKNSKTKNSSLKFNITKKSSRINELHQILMGHAYNSLEEVKKANLEKGQIFLLAHYETDMQLITKELPTISVVHLAEKGEPMRFGTIKITDPQGRYKFAFVPDKLNQSTLRNFKDMEDMARKFKKCHLKGLFSPESKKTHRARSKNNNKAKGKSGSLSSKQTVLKEKDLKKDVKGKGRLHQQLQAHQQAGQDLKRMLDDLGERKSQGGILYNIINIINIIREDNDFINSKGNKSDRTIIHYLVKSAIEQPGALKYLREMLDCGPKIDIKDSEGNSPIEILTKATDELSASGFECLYILGEYIIQKHTNDRIDNRGGVEDSIAALDMCLKKLAKNPFVWIGRYASRLLEKELLKPSNKQDINIIYLCLKYGADVEHSIDVEHNINKCYRPLHLAGTVQICALLIERGARPVTGDTDEEMPYDYILKRSTISEEQEIKFTAIFFAEQLLNTEIHDTKYFEKIAFRCEKICEGTVMFNTLNFMVKNYRSIIEKKANNFRDPMSLTRALFRNYSGNSLTQYRFTANYSSIIYRIIHDRSINSPYEMIKKIIQDITPPMQTNQRNLKPSANLASNSGLLTTLICACLVTGIDFNCKYSDEDHNMVLFTLKEQQPHLYLKPHLQSEYNKTAIDQSTIDISPGLRL